MTVGGISKEGLLRGRGNNRAGSRSNVGREAGVVGALDLIGHLVGVVESLNVGFPLASVADDSHLQISHLLLLLRLMLSLLLLPQLFQTVQGELLVAERALLLLVRNLGLQPAIQTLSVEEMVADRYLLYVNSFDEVFDTNDALALFEVVETLVIFLFFEEALQVGEAVAFRGFGLLLADVGGNGLVERAHVVLLAAAHSDDCDDANADENDHANEEY